MKEILCHQELNKNIAFAVKMGGLVFLLGLILFVGSYWDTPVVSMFSLFGEIEMLFSDVEIAKIGFLSLGMYLMMFFFLRSRINGGILRNIPWLVYLLIINLSWWAFGDSSSANFSLTLTSGVVVAQAVTLWTEFEINQKLDRTLFGSTIFVLIFFLFLASNSKTRFYQLEYQSHARWNGPWDNPNMFGLFMGVGMVLAAGNILEAQRYRGTINVFKVCHVVCYSIIFALMGRGLVNSYSRGAWLGTVCGLVFTVASFFAYAYPLKCGNMFTTCFFSYMQKNLFPIFIIVSSLIIFSFLHFSETKWHPARRVFSVFNSGDFSWRNRVAAWEGSLQIMVEKPLFGVGWEKSEPLYEHFYVSSKVTEGAAIETNDYLMIGTALGIPALICFGIYTGLLLNRRVYAKRPETEVGIQDSELKRVAWLKLVCRAGAIVLLVGFWFDGGLFKFATAAIFWILVELGNVQIKPRIHTDRRS